jgi:hypothetical protein
MLTATLSVAIAGVFLMGAQTNKPPGVENGVATIVDSGSTNRAGFRLAVDRSGNAEVTGQLRRFGQDPPPVPMRQTLPKALVETFYANLKAAGRLDSLPAVHCAKSASFGSTLTVAFGNERSPDLSCGDAGNPALRDLIGVVRQIVALADVQDMRLKRQIR